MIAPCLNCKDRSVGCHSHCAAYTTYKEKLAAKRAQISSDVKAYWAVQKYKKDKRAERYKRHN